MPQRVQKVIYENNLRAAGTGGRGSLSISTRRTRRKQANDVKDGQASRPPATNNVANTGAIPSIHIRISSTLRPRLTSEELTEPPFIAQNSSRCAGMAFSIQLSWWV